MALTPNERKLRATAAAHSRWAHVDNRTAATEAARAGFMATFEDEVDPDRVLPAEERARRAENARKAYFAKLALASARARRRKGSGDAA